MPYITILVSISSLICEQRRFVNESLSAWQASSIKLLLLAPLRLGVRPITIPHNEFCFRARCNSSLAVILGAKSWQWLRQASPRAHSSLSCGLISVRSRNQRYSPDERDRDSHALLSAYFCEPNRPIWRIHRGLFFGQKQAFRSPAKQDGGFACPIKLITNSRTRIRGLRDNLSPWRFCAPKAYCCRL